MKNYINITLLLLVFTVSNLFGQTTISRQVIGTTGGYSEGTSITLSSTVGETVVQSHFSTNLILTQGFQQTSSDSIVTYEVMNASCIGATNGSIFINKVLGCTGPYTLVVTPVNGTGTLNEKTLPSGNYNVTVTGTGGCTANIIVFVGLDSDEDCTLKFYSGFTPNGDGVNDLWVIDNIEVFPENTVQIYNRWGNEVWVGENYDNVSVVWDGNNKSGNTMVDATYFYVAEVDGQNYKGWIEITR